MRLGAAIKDAASEMNNSTNTYGFNVPPGVVGRALRAGERKLAPVLTAAVFVAVLAIVLLGPGASN